MLSTCRATGATPAGRTCASGSQEASLHVRSVSEASLPPTATSTTLSPANAQTQHTRASAKRRFFAKTLRRDELVKKHASAPVVAVEMAGDRIDDAQADRSVLCACRSTEILLNGAQQTWAQKTYHAALTKYDVRK
eukprot:6179616-Pleurochrysis_carterae.AAC.1